MKGAIVIYAGLITPFSVYLLVTFFRTLAAGAVRGRAHRRRRRPADPAEDRDSAVALPGPAHPWVVVNALYVWNDLLIAIHLPAGRRQADTDGGDQRVPGPLQ
jgi:hypothetical protein